MPFLLFWLMQILVLASCIGSDLLKEQDLCTNTPYR